MKFFNYLPTLAAAAAAAAKAVKNCGHIDFFAKGLFHTTFRSTMPQGLIFPFLSTNIFPRNDASFV
jgi:hypothetical protein